MLRQAAHSTRPVSTHRIRLRIQGHRHQQKNEPAQGRCLPRRPRLTGGHLRRAQDALPDGLRTGQDPSRQPTVHVRRHPCSQPHSRATDPTRPSRPWHDRKARRAVVLPGDRDPSSYLHPVRRAHDSPSRQIDPLHEQQRSSRKRAPTCSRNTERRRLTYILREFMQQSGLHRLRRRQASMRPRLKAAENGVLGIRSEPRRRASMRPRHKAAENRELRRLQDLDRAGFNEAAA